MTDALARLRALRDRPHNFLNKTQAEEGSRLAFEALEAMHADRRLPSFAELEEIATNPHALAGFHDWCQRTRRFSLWTQEAIANLAAYLRERGFRRVVEVGAGRGDLSWHLEQHGTVILATDLGEASLRGFTLEEYRDLSVEMWENVFPMDWHVALQRLKPDCVLCAWMPPDQDWTPRFRDTPSLREYVLFWELRGTTGGESAFRSNPGWQSVDLVEVDKYLVGRTDEGMPGLGLTQYTKATAFRRVDS